MPVFIAVILLVVASFIGGYLISLKPNRNRGDRFRPFEEGYIAHRGLFDNESSYPENSGAAFARAVEHGYGIELDVQITKDEKLVVFHDDNLLRMCGEERKVKDCTFEELQQYCLLTSKERIPLFRDVLDIIDGKVPVIVEIKSSYFWLETTKVTAEILDGYKGCYCVESFHPFVLEWFKRNRPETIRGQLSTDYFRDKHPMSFFVKFIMTNLLLNWKVKPDFISYNHIYKNQFSYRLLRKLYHIKNVAWTVRSQQELDEAEDVFSCIIFDSFIPRKKTSQ